MGEAALFTAAIASVVGSGIQAHAANKAAKRQASAANSAAKAMDKAAKTSVITTTEAAAPVTQSAEASEASVQRAAKKRFSYSSTVNNFTPTGLRKTLG